MPKWAPALTFIIPVRHHLNARDWDCQLRNLSQTVASISAQTSPNWEAVVVANEDSPLPEFPARFSVVRVAFPPNAHHERNGISQEDFYEAFRIDKGRRVLAGLLQAKPKGHIMIVDDDDLINYALTGYVESHPREPGWSVTEGWIWTDGGNWLYRSRNFNKLCGTSHIIRADLYMVPTSMQNADDTYIRRWLGSHIFIEDILSRRGIVLKVLPFAGAVYRVGHAGAHSKSSGALRTFVFRKNLATVLRSVLNLRFRTSAKLEEFWGRRRT